MQSFKSHQTNLYCTRQRILQQIYEKREKQVLKPILTNEDPQKTIVVRSPMERHQIDLINMSAYASEIGGKVYKYILSIIDIFTRFLWLIPFENAQSASVTEALSSRPANKLYCAKKYQNMHFVLQAGIYIHLMRKNVLFKY